MNFLWPPWGRGANLPISSREARKQFPFKCAKLLTRTVGWDSFCHSHCYTFRRLPSHSESDLGELPSPIFSLLANYVHAALFAVRIYEIDVFHYLWIIANAWISPTHFMKGMWSSSIEKWKFIMSISSQILPGSNVLPHLLHILATK